MTGCGTERYADWFFDLDGTLVDSAPDILRLLGGVLREEGARRAQTGQRAHQAASQKTSSAGSLPGSGPCGSGAHRHVSTGRATITAR